MKNIKDINYKNNNNDNYNYTNNINSTILFI